MRFERMLERPQRTCGNMVSHSMKLRACSLIPCLFGSMKKFLMAGTDQFSPVGTQNDGIVE